MHPRFVPQITVLLALIWSCAGAPPAQGEEGVAAALVKRALIVSAQQSTVPEQKAAAMLRSRMMKRSAIEVGVVKEGAADLAAQAGGADAVFVLGMPERNALAAALMKEFGASLPALPNSDTKHPEGYVIKSGTHAGKPHVLCAGADERGTIYAVGAVLRAMTYLPDGVMIPSLDMRDKPAFPMRGARPSGPGSRARQFGQLRPKTAEEHIEMMEDLMLLGCNIFEEEPAREYGMLSYFGRTANEMPAGFPKEWGADGQRSPKYVCPSVPEARKALLESFDEMCRTAKDYDYFTTNSGDEGGCRCERCEPWGATYIKLVHEIADILHKYHPNCKVLATNQDLTNEGNEAIFKYLNEGDASWLHAIRYGPGADEMQTYIRGPVNPRWFEYEGFGPLANYLKYMHHELPPTTHIALYSDITHWMQAQFAVAKPDVALAAVYDRRSWNARPRNFHRVGQEILHYAIGDMHYSEGMHDDFNKWFWYRLLWNPHQTAEAITAEYCRFWFGPEAQDEMSQAIFLMEETLERSVLDNPGIARAVDLLHEASTQIPENLRRIDWRWHLILEKALMDRYIQLKLDRGQALKGEAATALVEAQTGDKPLDAVRRALAIMEQPLETDEMRAVMEEALKEGEASNQAIGYREPAPYLVADLDLSEAGWWAKVLRQAVEANTDAAARNTVNMILHYDDPGPGGFYDDAGWPSDAPHLTHGEALWGFMPFGGPARQSHYSLAYAMGYSGQGVSFAYEGLDPAAQYVVRISVGAHLDEESPGRRDMKLAEGMKADDAVLSEGFEVPMGDTTFQEFDVPQGVTTDGAVEISLTPQASFFPVTALYEIWLMRKDAMPWTARP